MNSLFWLTAGFLSGVLFSTFFEWTLHRYFMHRPFGKFDYPFKAHAQVHHGIFKADHTYHLINPADRKTIPMAWWNGPVLLAICHIPFIVVAWLTGHWGLYVGAAISTISYFATYEYLHYCMHLPKKRGLERSGVFFRLNGHHILHHRYMHKNFNVVLPLADLALGTLLLRSKIPFPQPSGPSVPNVQPPKESEEPRSFPRRFGGFILQFFTGVKAG